MIAMRPISAATVFTPSPSDIAAATKAIRDRWRSDEHDSRLTDGINAQVRLLASLLKPMAVEAGLIPAPVAEVIPEVETNWSQNDSAA